MDFLSALFGGQTGTDDPARAGFSFPSLIGSTQAAEPPRPMPGYLPPDAMPAPPPIPGPMPMPPGPPQAPGPQMQPGGAKILARLYNPEPIQAPGGDDISRIVNLIGPQSGPYAAMQQTARNAQGAGQPPAAQPMPQQPPQQQPAAPSLGASAPVAAPRTLSRADQMEASQHFQFQAPPSTKPGFYDNLLRFGLAAMAAGGKPGSNTLGALGEAGLSTFDTNQKAGQTDFENSIASRKLYYTGQDIINKRLEQAEALQVRADAIKENSATKLQLGQDAANMRAQALALQKDIADGRHSDAQARIEQMQRDLASKDADRADKTEDRRTAEARRAQDAADKQAETNQKDANSFYERRRNAMEKNAPMGLTEQQEAQLMAQAARFKGSTYEREWATTKQGYLDTVRRGLQAYPNDPVKRKQAIDRLRSMGIDGSEL